MRGSRYVHMPTCMPTRMCIHKANCAASGCSKWADLMAIKEFKVECVSACKAGTCHSPLHSDTRVDVRTDMQSRQQFVCVWHDSDAEAGRQRLWRRQRENHLLQVLPKTAPPPDPTDAIYNLSLVLTGTSSTADDISMVSIRN